MCMIPQMIVKKYESGFLLDELKNVGYYFHRDFGTCLHEYKNVCV